MVLSELALMYRRQITHVEHVGDQLHLNSSQRSSGRVFVEGAAGPRKGFATLSHAWWWPPCTPYKMSGLS
jgi:hypothetical protein